MSCVYLDSYQLPVLQIVNFSDLEGCKISF